MEIGYGNGNQEMKGFLDDRNVCGGGGGVGEENVSVCGGRESIKKLVSFTVHQVTSFVLIQNSSPLSSRLS